MPAIDLSVLCIPAECDNIILPIECEIASRWDAYLLCDICRHFASVMLHFASLISHNLRCIPAYAHQIPTGFFQSKLSHGQLVYHFLKKASPALYALDLPKMLELFFKLGIRFYRISAPITLYLRSPQMMWISPFSITLRARGARVLMSVTPVVILPSIV